MLIWTTIVAFFLGMGITIWPLTGWKIEFLNRSDWLVDIGTIAFSTAVFAVIELICILSRKRRLGKIIIAVAIIGIAAWLLPIFARSINGDAFRSENEIILVFASVQFAILSSTIASLRWSGWFNEKHRAKPEKGFCFTRDRGKDVAPSVNIENSAELLDKMEEGRDVSH